MKIPTNPRLVLTENPQAPVFDPVYPSNTSTPFWSAAQAAVSDEAGAPSVNGRMDTSLLDGASRGTSGR